MAPTNGMEQNAPQEDEIARRAYEIYLQRGCAHGLDLDDWLQAEHELTRTGEEARA